MSSDPYDLVEKAIDEGSKLGAKYIEARYVNLGGNTSILKNGVPELGGIVRSRGIGIRVLKDGGVGFASFNEINKEPERWEAFLQQVLDQLAAKESTHMENLPDREKTFLKRAVK